MSRKIDIDTLIKEVTGFLADLNGSYLTPELAKGCPSSYGEMRRRSLELQGQCFNYTLAKEPEYYGARLAHNRKIASERVRLIEDELYAVMPLPKEAPDGSLSVTGRTKFHYTARCSHCGNKFTDYHYAYGSPIDLCDDCLPF